MGVFVQNVQVVCPYCGQTNISGKESEQKLRNGDLQVECRWVCDRCGMVARHDENIIPAPKPEEKKEETKKDEAKQ